MSLLRKSMLVLILASAYTVSLAAKAQTAVYGAATLTGYGFTTNGNSALSLKTDSGGLTAGAFHNFPIHSRVTVGLDGRVEYSPGNNGGFAATGALRVGFVPHRVRLRPYFQIGGGVVHSGYNSTEIVGYSPSTYVTTRENVTSGVAQFLLGLDARVTGSLDWRALEYGADAPGSGSSAVHTGVAYLDTGLVYHLRSKP
jgi:hypothetical protein